MRTHHSTGNPFSFTRCAGAIAALIAGSGALLLLIGGGVGADDRDATNPDPDTARPAAALRLAVDPDTGEITQEPSAPLPSAALEVGEPSVEPVQEVLADGTVLAHLGTARMVAARVEVGGDGDLRATCGHQAHGPDTHHTAPAAIPAAAAVR